MNRIFLTAGLEVSEGERGPCPVLRTNLSSSFVLEEVVFFLFGTGILQSMEKATQLVHGIPSEAASQRT